MAIASLVSVQEYLSTVYHPDRDFIDGEIRERNLGEYEHSSTQREILLSLSTRYPRLRRRLLPEQRVQVKATRFRIPDVCLLAQDTPTERIVRTAPGLCIEILSREDSMSDIMERIQDYFDLGTPVCWIIDPIRGRGWVAVPGQMIEPADRVLRAGEIEMPLEEVLELHRH